MSAGLIALIVVLVALAVVAGFVVGPMMRSRRLRNQFGPEYDRVIAERRSRKLGEAELTQRQHRVQQFNLTDLSDAARVSYQADWDRLQERFVDEPGNATADAERLVESVVRELGYPDEGFEQMMADLSVHHGKVVENLRTAHDIGGKHAAGEATTEDLRVALLQYRQLFTELLAGRPAAADRGQETALPVSATTARAESDGAENDGTESDGTESDREPAEPARGQQ